MRCACVPPLYRERMVHRVEHMLFRKLYASAASCTRAYRGRFSPARRSMPTPGVTDLSVCENGSGRTRTRNDRYGRRRTNSTSRRQSPDSSSLGKLGGRNRPVQCRVHECALSALITTYLENLPRADAHHIHISTNAPNRYALSLHPS